MADFGGFDITLPEDVLAQQNAVRQKAALSGNAQVMRTTNIESALDALFGNPQLNKAKQVQSRIQAATAAAGSEQNPGENDLDFSIRRLKGMRDAVADIDPATASQINTQLLKFGEMKMQRDLLQARESRESAEFDLKKPELQAQSAVNKINGGLTYVVNMTGGEIRAKAFDLQDPSVTAEFRKAASEPGAAVVSPTQMQDIYKDERQADLRRELAKAQGQVGSVGKNAWNAVEKQGAGLVELYDTVGRIVNVFQENPDALSAASKGAKALDTLTAQLAAGARVANGNTTYEGSNIDSFLKQNNITNSRAQSLTIGLAYAIAKAQDGSGRISDRDLLAAKEALGGDNPRPEVMLANLNDRLVTQTQALNDRLGWLDSEGEAPPFIRAMKGTIANKQKGFNDSWSKYVNSRAPGAPPNVGNQGQPDKDGWVTRGNIRIRVKPGQ